MVQSLVICPNLAPWLTVADGEAALRFYLAAFGAVVVYRLEEPGAGIVVRLAIGSAEFWISDGAPAGGDAPALGGGSVRMILTVADPDALFARAIGAGARQIFAVGEDHGWRLGRLTDPFGLDWEIGRPLD